jgi:hypothetical protein
MLETLRFHNFKSWHDTGEIQLAPITGFFGTNSSGKSSLLQFLLMLKQTVESNDQQQVLNLGSDRTYVDLGTSYDIVHQPSEQQPQVIEFAIGWHLSETAPNPQLPTRAVIETDGKLRIISVSTPVDNLNVMPMIGDPITGFKFEAAISFDTNEIKPQQFVYHYQAMEHWNQVGMSLMPDTPSNPYQLLLSGVPAQIAHGRNPHDLPDPTKFYGFPGEARLHFSAENFLPTLSLSLERVFSQIYYLGPLRDFPKRNYTWSGERPQDVGRRGELAVAALLAAKEQDPEVEIKVAGWLKKLGLVDDFKVQPIAPNRRDYEVRLCSRPNSVKAVLITDVGFGVSQILPVLVLCHYAPAGSTVILEQPEIHLHPSVQAGLADLFVEVALERNLQIIVESHSEHLLRRLQRRIAEAELITHEQAALYFCNMDDTGASHLTPLALDEFGNINNWPAGFFGDEMGDLVAMSEAALRRQMAREHQE